jgi:NAD(P)-dependent dehydrogenase (short-subunit alcohol dehydrogenase family)
MTRPLAECVALVTGAGRGLGRAVAIELARLGAQVVATGRTQGALEETDDLIRGAGGAATLLPLDLSEGAGLDPIGPSLFHRFGRLDILVHCAAELGRLTPASHLDMKDWDAAMAANLSGPLRLIRTCAPLLLAAPAGRAVFVTDRRARAPFAYWAAYGAGKAALEHLVLSWADELRDARLRINLFDPGIMATRLRRHAFPGEDQAGLRRPEAVAPQLVALCLPGETRHGALVTAD